VKMYVGTEWIDTDQKIEVLSPWDGSLYDTVPSASTQDVETALATAEIGAKKMASLTGFERYQILHRAADMIVEKQEDLAQTITHEMGKIITEARVEVERAAEIIYLSAEEAKRLGSEVIPLDGGPGVTHDKFGFTIRVPCGVVLAITPFNFPLHLVCHKVGPALAAGNAVISKPTSDTPIVALRLCEIMLEAGVPSEAIQCITGSGSTVGNALAADPRVRKISFTGSREVGEAICRTAGLKKVTMELGSNAPVIIMPDADMNKVHTALLSTAYANAGQVCISTQRIYADSTVYDDFIDSFSERVGKLSYGDPRDENVQMGPLVRESDAVRVEEWINSAINDGAKLVTGGSRNGAFVEPTLLANVDKSMRVSCDELFGPAAGVSKVDNIEEAIALANDTNYGLSAAIFTESLDSAMKFARQVDSGNLHINFGTQWRTDLMPYGGVKESGFGKEGPSYAVEEMTETKMVVMHL